MGLVMSLVSTEKMLVYSSCVETFDSVPDDPTDLGSLMGSGKCFWQ